MSNSSNGLRVAFSHDWLNGMRGGEKCLEALCEVYPDSVIHTLFHQKGRVSAVIEGRPIRTSRIQNFPKAFQYYRYYLPFFPAAIEQFRLENFDAIISTSHCVAKSIPKSNGTPHISYCFTPMRYAWGLFEDYFGNKNPVIKKLIGRSLSKIREWDKATSENVDCFVAISRHIEKRIWSAYGKKAEVIYPPVDTDFYYPDAGAPREDFYLVVSALVPYKKVELAIDACRRLGRNLVVIGDGPERRSLERRAGAETRFLGWQSDETLRDYYRRAKALLFPGEEDFGIVPVEVQACGGFVIGYAKGGVLETVIDGETGLFFKEPSAESLAEGILKFEKAALNLTDSRRNASRYSRERFKSQMRELIDRVVKNRGDNKC
jgi:glycosyltransferase involved in cell wall biosynthesis